MTDPRILDGFELSGPQADAALARGRDVAVTAGAGTGKTRTLVARYLSLLADDVPLRQIVAVTFTRKAAREMRNRVRQEIGRYLAQDDLGGGERERWQQYYNELDAARIGTIHNLCADILRAHPAEAGIDPRFAVLDETQSAILVEEAAEAALAWAVESEESAPLFTLLREQQLHDVIITLIENRLVAAEITNNLPAEDIYNHWQETLHERQEAVLERMLCDAEFVAARNTLVYNQATNPEDKREYQRRLALGALEDLEGQSTQGKLRNLAALGEIELVGGSQNNWPGGREQLDEVKEALRILRTKYTDQKLLNLRLNEQDEAITAAMPAIYTLFNQAQTYYRELKSERESLDFDDLEALAIALLEEHDDARRYWQRQVGALLVDEFQDTNERQCYFIRLLCPDAGKLFIVGDAKQSIYRFRGADVAVFAREKEQIDRQEGSLIDLDISYRAHEPLLEGMNGLLRPVLGDDNPDRPPWAAPFAPLKAGLTAVPGHLSSPFIEFHLTLGTKKEALPRAASALVQRMAQLRSDHGIDFGEMAILCRASSSFQYYENAFDAAGIPYLTVAGKGFYDRPEIRDLLNALQAIVDPHDDLALAGLLRSPACGLSDITLYHLSKARTADQTLWETIQQAGLASDQQQSERLHTAVDMIHDLNQRAGRTPAADLLKRYLELTYYRAIVRRTGQPRALRNVAKLLEDIHASGLISVAEFLEYIQTLRDSGAREGEARATAGGAVQIMTIHAAKGLEFPVVVLGDAAKEGRGRSRIAVDSRLGILLPYRNDEDLQSASYEMWAARSKEQDDAETARLLYVALTRAEQMLIVSGNMQQNKSGSLSGKGWLKQLADISGITTASLNKYDEDGCEQHEFEFTLPAERPMPGTTVRATFYEPNFPMLEAPPAVTEPQTAGEQPARRSLQDSLIKDTVPEEEDGEAPRLVWQIVPLEERTRAPAWVIGSLVHEALSLWRFTETGFEEWVAARAQEHGLANKHQLRDAQRRTSELLQRFQKSALYREINEASRRLHEVPFNHLSDGDAKFGRIDLLYNSDGTWHVVDYKTDNIRDAAELKKLEDEKGYKEQLQEYGRAVEQLLGMTPLLMLCYLDCVGDIKVRSISIE
ncbi:MAG: UvrD-helicase domain-containing protein [Candidatus Promineifilaceae bacterium]